MRLSSFLLSFVIVQTTWAQNVGVQIDNANAGKNTTIEIKEGTASTSSTLPKFEITPGEEPIEGESALLVKEAKKNWKKACEDWKKEFRELNKENKILSMNCGTQNCSTQSGETTCTSKATYKVKVKME